MDVVDVVVDVVVVVVVVVVDVVDDVVVVVVVLVVLVVVVVVVVSVVPGTNAEGADDVGAEVGEALVGAAVLQLGAEQRLGHTLTKKGHREADVEGVTNAVQYGASTAPARSEPSGHAIVGAHVGVTVGGGVRGT